VLIFLLWLPFSMAALWLGQQLVARLIHENDPVRVREAVQHATTGQRALVFTALFAPRIGAFVAGLLAGGFLVARFSEKAAAKEAGVAGLTAATAAWILTAAVSGNFVASLWLWPPAALLGFAAAYGGGAWGKRTKR